MKDITIDILPDGTIRYTRSDFVSNDILSKILEQLAPDSKEKVREFLEGSKEIEIIIGSESLCG